MKKTKALGTEKIGKLLFQLSLPSTIGMMVIMLYHAVDMMFIGRGVGTHGIAGIAIVFPIQMLISAFGQLVGIGGSSIISRSLGAKDLDKANRTLANIIGLNFLISTFVAIVIFIFMKEVLITFGASDTILGPATEYFTIIILAAPILSFMMMINSVLRAEGNANAAMMVMLTSAVANIILDPIFIFSLDMGMRGAAIATVIAQIFALIFVVYHYLAGKSIFTLKSSYFKPKKSILKETFAIGASSFVRQGGASITTAFLNHGLHTYGGDLAIAAFGIVGPVIRFVFFPLIGLVQGSMPIFGYNYGARNYKRVREALKITNYSSFIISIISFSILFVFTEFLVSVFSKDSELIKLTSHAMRIVIILLPVIGFQMIVSGYFQALGKAIPSFILVGVRQIMAPILFILTLPLLFDLDGLWMVFPFADGVALILSVIMVLPQYKMLKEKSSKSIVEAS